MMAFARKIERGFAVVGLVLSSLFVAGFVADIRAADETRGGYEPPYDGWTGTLNDWDSHDRTSVAS